MEEVLEKLSCVQVRSHGGREAVVVVRGGIGLPNGD